MGEQLFRQDRLLWRLRADRPLGRRALRHPDHRGQYRSYNGSECVTPISPAAFFDHIRTELFSGTMTQSQVDGTNAILAGSPDGTDTRFVAYELATAHWETARTMQPIREYGEGRGHGYGLPTGPWHMVYYGRGLDQLTFLDNYVKANTILHERSV